MIPTLTTVSGQAAVECSASFPSLTDEFPITVWVELADNRTLRLAIGVVGSDPASELLDSVRSILATLEIAEAR